MRGGNPRKGLSGSVLSRACPPLLQQNIKRAESAVALTRGHERDNIPAKVAGKPLDDRLFDPGAFD
jgi:hypothetical protein